MKQTERTESPHPVPPSRIVHRRTAHAQRQSVAFVAGIKKWGKKSLGTVVYHLVSRIAGVYQHRSDTAITACHAMRCKPLPIDAT